MPEEDAATLALDFDVGFAIKEKVNTCVTVHFGLFLRAFRFIPSCISVYSFDFAVHHGYFHFKISLHHAFLIVTY